MRKVRSPDQVMAVVKELLSQLDTFADEDLKVGVIQQKANLSPSWLVRNNRRDWIKGALDREKARRRQSRAQSESNGGPATAPTEPLPVVAGDSEAEALRQQVAELQSQIAALQAAQRPALDLEVLEQKRAALEHEAQEISYQIEELTRCRAAALHKAEVLNEVIQVLKGGSDALV